MKKYFLIKITIFASILTKLTSCYVMQDDYIADDQLTYRTIDFRIEPGNHHASNFQLRAIEFLPQLNYRQRRESTFQVQFKFTVPPVYQFTGAQQSDQDDWNKLIGFSDCGHFDAYTGFGALLGWRWNTKTRQIEVASYVHADGKKNQRSVVMFKKTLEASKNYFLKILIPSSDNYQHYLYALSERADFAPQQTEEVVQKRGCAGSSYVGGRLINPWFGGTQPSPINIELQVGFVEKP